MVPILRVFQHVYSDRELADNVLALIAKDVRDGKRTDTGRTGMNDWHICGLAVAGLECDFTYDQLQDLAESQRNLRAVMGVSERDETEFHSMTIRNTICLLKSAMLETTNRLIVGAGNAQLPEAIQFGRQVLVFEDSAGFIVRSVLSYMQLSVLGRNLLTLGRLLIRQEQEHSPAGLSRRKAA